MPRCELCGNDYDKTLSVALAEAGGNIYCCAHCARQEGASGIRDRA